MTALPMPTVCPDDNVLAGFASGALPVADVPEVEAHLDSCAGCRALVAAVAAESSVPDVSAPEAPTRLDTGAPTLPEVGTGPVLPPGTRLGPYVLRELLGAGGMGVVYAAEDPRLGRRVALKLLRPLRDDAGGEYAARLLREAQAMARLSHPNVLPIFELGAADGRDFLAMEWVEGTTLAGWLKERERPWREVLELCLAAGAGLAAAHRAGLVHRDFKPANVLVGRDGRARVTDFGLARQGPAGQDAALLPSEGAQAPGLTRAGAVPGTPAYMSPEQRAGRPVDARSDQYSFCVTLHEALLGERPSPSRPHPRVSGLPRYVREALARGLAPEPEDRFPSMDALLAALAQPPRTRLKALAAPLAAAGVLLGGGLGVLLWQGDFGTRETPAEAGSHPLIQMRVGAERELRVSGLERIAVGDPAIVDIRVTEEAVRLTGLTPGSTSLMLWTRDDPLQLYTVSVTGP